MGKADLQKQRADLVRLTDEIRIRKGRVAKDLHGIGVRLRRIQQEELWRAKRFESFDDYLVRGAEVSRASAYNFMRIADHFNAEITQRYGVSKLRAALRYMSATQAVESPGDVLAADILVRDEEGQYHSLALHDASATQINDAVRMLKKNRRARVKHGVPAAWRKRAARIEAQLPDAPKGTARGKRVRLTRGSDGKLAISFLAVPVSELAAFVDRLRDQL